MPVSTIKPLPPSDPSMANPGNLHFLPDGRVFLKEQIHVHVEVAGADAPRHPSHYLQEGRVLLLTDPQEGKRGGWEGHKLLHTSHRLSKYTELQLSGVDACVFMCVHMHVEARYQTLVLILRCCRPCLLRQSLSRAWTLPI